MILASQFKRFFRAAILSTVVLASQGSAFAGPIAIQTPNGLTNGQQFRIIFVTQDKVSAVSNNITTYDNFVNTEAAGATYNGQTVHWSAIGSTDAIDAKFHIGQTGAAVYMANGTEVATSDNGTGLWSGNDLLAQPTQDLAGNSYTSGVVWTGTSGIGTEYNTSVSGQGTVYWGLGATNNVTQGGVTYINNVEVGSLHQNVGGYDWISLGFGTGLAPRTNNYQVYGISDVLTVNTAPVPEPSTLLISGLGVLAIGIARRFRKQA
jgi:PEP-CTERM motif